VKLLELLQDVPANKSNQLKTNMVGHVKHAQEIKLVSLLMLMEIIHNVLLFNALLLHKFSDTIWHAQDVIIVTYHRFQMLHRDHATDQDQFAHANRNIQLMVSHVSNAHKVNSLLPIEANVSHLDALETPFQTSNWLVQNVKTAQQERSQIHQEELVSDLDQNAHAHNSTHQTDTHALTAQLDNLVQLHGELMVK